MTAQIVYVESAKLHIAIVDGRIVKIEKATGDINPHAIHADNLDATTGRTHVHIADRDVYGDRSTLYLDAADMTTFAAWLHGQMPNASVKAFGNAMFGYFPGSMYFKEMLVAAGQVVCAPALKRPPGGEELYFIERAKASDPEGFAELAATYAASAAPKPDQ